MAMTGRQNKIGPPGLTLVPELTSSGLISAAHLTMFRLLVVKLVDQQKDLDPKLSYDRNRRRMPRVCVRNFGSSAPATAG